MIKLALTFIALNGLDLGLTLWFVGSGMAYELNPVMQWVLTLPLYSIIGFKLGIPVFLSMAIVELSQHEAVSWFNFRAVLWVLVVAEAGVCLFNLSGLIL